MEYYVYNNLQVHQCFQASTLDAAKSYADYNRNQWLSCNPKSEVQYRVIYQRTGEVLYRTGESESHARKS